MKTLRVFFLNALFFVPTLCFGLDTDFCTDWGKVGVCLPIASGVQAAFGYDFNGHQTQGLAETPVGVWNAFPASRIVFKFGGVTTDNGRGSPFLGADYEITSGINTTIGLVQPGIYGGRDFNENTWMYGIKFAISVVK